MMGKLFAILHLFFGWLPQIKKVSYKGYEKPENGTKKLTKTGYCYYLFYNQWSPKGFRIPFTLKTKQVR